MIMFSLITLAAALIGFWITQTIISKQHKGSSITCPVGFACDEVLGSSYSRFFGIPVVMMGRVYYLAIAALYLLGLFIELPYLLNIIFILLSGLAVLFSVYLTVIQVAVLRKWCSWCLLSALMSFIILVSSFIGFSESFAGFLFDARDMLSWIFAAGVMVGTVVTTLHAFTFVRFLKDFVISKKEYRLLGMYSHTAWVSLAFVFLSGLGLVLTDTYREITGNSEFLVMGVIIGVLAVYELLQNTIVAPRLLDVHFGDKPALDDHEHSYQRKIAFAFTAVGIASWYLLMLFSNLSWHEYDPLYLVGLYIVTIIVGVVVSLLAERIVYQKSLKARK